MTTSTHTYSAVLIGSPDVALKVKGGSVTLDAGSAPHVTGSIDIPMPDATTLAALDPRVNARIRLSVSAVFPTGTQTRTFDLGLRDRDVQLDTATVTLTLASDEALLMDYAPLADDYSAFTYQSSLRAVINGVLASVGGNLNPNPGAAVDTTGWVASSIGGGAATVTRVTGISAASSKTGIRATLSTTGATSFGAQSSGIDFPVLAGTSYRARAELRPSVNKTVGLRVEWRDASHAMLSTSSYTSDTPGANKWAVLETPALVAPAGAAFAYLAGRITSSPALGDILDITGATISANASAPPQLEGLPNNEASAQTYSDSVNVCDNPSAIVDTTGWSPVGVASVTRQTAATWADNSADTAFRLNGNSGTSASYISYFPSTTSLAGRTIIVRARQLNGSSAMTGTTDPNYLRIAVYASTNGGGAYTKLGDSGAGPTAANAQQDHYVRVDVPWDVNLLGVRLTHGVQTANVMYWADVRISEYTGDPTDQGYFDGSTTDTASYAYDWSGTTGQSTSNRSALVDRPVDALIWRAGQSALDYLAPLVQVAGFRLVCDEARDWTLRDETYVAAGSLNVQYAVNMISGGDVISRDEGIWYDAAVTRYRWTDTNGIQQERVDAYALSGSWSRVMLFEKDTAYPGPGFSQYAVGRAQGRGREVTTTTVADWTGRAEQPVTVVLSGEPTQVGASQSLTFDLDTDQMDVTTRTTDTPTGAIDLLSGTVDSLSGTIDSL